MSNTSNNIIEQENNTFNDSSENLKELYKRYCECREQEVNRFWENSKYVWTFLAVCFAGYGVLLTDDSTIIVNYFPYLSLFVSCVGIVLSYLWLKMTQGSKIWYEVYEMAIWEIESYANKFNFDPKFLIHNFWTSKDGEKGISPSKIMILIGYLLVIVWFAALFFSFLVFAKEDYSISIICPCVIFLLITLLFIVWIEMKYNYIISSAIRTREEERIFKKVKMDIYPLLTQNEYLYIEIKTMDKEKFVVFKFSEDNVDKAVEIMSLFPIKNYKVDGYDIRLNLSEMESYYDNIEQKINILKNEIKDKIIVKRGKDIVIYTSKLTIDDDFNKIKTSIEEKYLNNISKDDNKIIIPIDYLKTN